LNLDEYNDLIISLKFWAKYGKASILETET